ncbi:PIG-L deacetylase family protein [Actinomyces faecalis]|uniref:PIG-L deacetylase family protein n=1 Tax=Actinomyces faecalis TaxID=2722820 RepID=UPI001552108C|nr:PIG-L family deacetylase [Actinomyces faecalis]
MAERLGHRRVLGVYAHPDDADVGAGATIHRLVREGAEISLLVATSGDAGGYEAEGQEQISQVRRLEQQAAAAYLGVSEVVFLNGFADGHVAEGSGLVREVVAAIRRWRPSLVLSMSPEYNFASVAASHPDHRAVGRAVVDAAYPASGNRFDYRELAAAGLEPHEVDEVWFQGHKETNHLVVVEPDDLEAKVAAVRSHVSQFRDLDGVEGYVRRAAAAAGGAGAATTGPADGACTGLEQPALAEPFFRWVLH